MPLRRFAVIGAALIGEDGVRDVTIAPRNDAAAVAAIARAGHTRLVCGLCVRPANRHQCAAGSHAPKNTPSAPPTLS